MASEHATAAKEIRKELKKNGIKARVTCSSYSMGSSVNVRINNELPATIAAIKLFADRYQYGHFNGMEDIYEYSNVSDLPQVKFVFVQNSYSDEVKQACWDYMCAHWAGLEDAPTNFREAHTVPVHGTWGDQLLSRTLYSDEKGGFWCQQKQRVAA